MKHLLVIIVGIILSPVACFAGQQSNLTTENSEMSYSIGYQVGSDFKKQEFEARPEMLLKGIQDALSKYKPLIPQAEMRDTLINLQKSINVDRR